jgi:hypothetical protein
VYSDDSSKIHVYDFILEDWTTKPNQLGSATATITTDGTLLYLAGGGNFKSYNPKTNEWVQLPIPTFPLDGMGGLRYHNGVIYAHSGNNNGFAKYTLATGIWETLVPLPDHAVLGSAIDPVKNRYYAYGINGSSYLYEYDIAVNVWTVFYCPLFEISNGGMAYVDKPGYEGVYFLQGEKGPGFGRYEPQTGLTWLRSSPLVGEISVSENQDVGINFNAKNLLAGLYHGVVHLTSNDPNHSAMDIPVTYNVVNRTPTIDVPTLFEDIVDRINPYTVQLKIQNKGKESLEWSFVKSLPSYLAATKTSGTIAGFSFDVVELTFYPGQFTSGITLDYLLDINSNDLLKPKVTTRLNLTLLNHQPVVLSTIPDQSLISSPIEITLAQYFSDPDQDELSYSATSSKPEIVSVTVFNSQLYITLGKPGTSRVTVQAIDIFNSFVTTSFDAVVKIVTDVDPVQSEEILTVSPNPFTNKFTIHYRAKYSKLLDVQIFDINGRIVWSKSRLDLDGSTEIEIDGSALPNGIYNCIIWDGDFMRSIRIIKN